MRIVSLCPSNTEILYELDVMEQVVGLDDHSDWPPEWQHLPRVGPDLTIDMNRVEALRPDLVLASLSVPGMERNLDELNKRNIPHLVLNPSHLDDIADDLRTVGRALGVEERGEQAAVRFESRLDSLRRQTASVSSRPRLYWEWWPNPIFTPGRDNWLTDVSQWAGGHNIFADVPQANVQATREMVQELDPEHICVVWCGIDLHRIKREMIAGRPEWASVTAIRNNNVHLLEEGLYCRPSPRILDGLEQLIRLLHPAAPARQKSNTE